jgi:hypothetical protein
MHVLTMLRT